MFCSCRSPARESSQWFPLELRVGRHRPEEAVVPAGGGEGQHYCRGEGDVVVVGGEVKRKPAHQARALDPVIPLRTVWRRSA